MHLRRALLLFAIVLTVAAIAASLAPPPDTQRSPTPPEQPPPARTDGDRQPEADDRPAAGETLQLRFDAAARRPPTRTVKRGRHVVITVTARESGEVRIDGLGVVGNVEPLTPAIFDLFPTSPGRYAVVYRPVEGEQRRAGLLVVAS